MKLWPHENQRTPSSPMFKSSIKPQLISTGLLQQDGRRMFLDVSKWRYPSLQSAGSPSRIFVRFRVFAVVVGEVGTLTPKS